MSPFPPSPGTPGEGWGEGFASFAGDLRPHAIALRLFKSAREKDLKPGKMLFLSKVLQVHDPQQLNYRPLEPAMQRSRPASNVKVVMVLSIVLPLSILLALGIGLTLIRFIFGVSLW